MDVDVFHVVPVAQLENREVVMMMRIRWLLLTALTALTVFLTGLGWSRVWRGIE